jgi:hypothetical protein
MARNDNANFGIGRIGGAGNVGLYSESSTAKYELGEKLELMDGRIFRYCNFDAAVTVGKMVGADQSTGAADEISDGVISGGSAGSTAVTLTASGSAGPPADFQGVSANDYAGSYLHTTDGDGEGFTYRIKSNGAASSDAVEFTLYDPIVTALATGATDWGISASRYNNCHITDATQGTLVDLFPTGVTMVGITSGYFAWVQTKGQATCLADGTITEGNQLTLSDGTNGAVQLKDAETEVAIGHSLTTVATGEYAPVMLNLE